MPGRYRNADTGEQFEMEYEDVAFEKLLAEEQKELDAAFPIELPDRFYGVEDNE